MLFLAQRLRALIATRILGPASFCWRSRQQSAHGVMLLIVLLGLSASWWFTAKHLRVQLAQVEQSARVQQAGWAALVSENLRQVIEKAQLMGVVAMQGVHSNSPWQQQLAHMLVRDPVFVRFALFDHNLQLLAGHAQAQQELQELLVHQQGACEEGKGALLLHQHVPAASSADTGAVPLLLCVTDGQGASQGYLLLRMDMGYFLRLHTDMDLGQSGSLHLLAPDGSEFAAMPRRRWLSSSPHPRLDAFKQVKEGAGAASFFLEPGKERLGSYHRAKYMPLTVVVSRDWQEIRQAHAEHAQRLWGLAVTVSVLMLLATWALFRSMMRRQHLLDGLTLADKKQQALIAQLESEKQRALELAASDPLTGLHNRRMFYELVSSHLALARRSRKHYALLYLDLDHFKQINDTLGHHAGDALLQAVADRLRGMLRGSDIIARMGGDEFAVLVTAMDDMQDMDGLAQELVSGLSAPYEGIAEQVVHTSTSMGIAFFPRDGHDVQVLCRHADTAMYASKKSGRNRYTYYDRVNNADNERRYRLLRQLPQAIADEQMVLHFQPKVRLEDCAIVGMEALVRWQHPEYGLIYPGDFIAMAEEHGHIQALGDWVMQACCRQIAAWRMQGMDVVPMAFNVSPLQLKDCAFPTRIATCLQHYGVRASDIEVEVTESCLVEPDGLSARVLYQLQNMGVHIALDDFGTGFSSLSQIRALPIGTIKLDKSFVNALRSSHEAGVLVTSIITLAHNLKMQVVAEGVELMDQLVYLKTAGCDVVQGYFLSRPVPAQQAEVLLKQGVLEPA